MIIEKQISDMWDALEHYRVEERLLLKFNNDLTNLTGELLGIEYDKAKQEMEWKAEDLDHLVLHQVSKVHTEQLAQTLGLSLDKVLTIYPEYGNIGPASVPFVLSKLAESGKLKSGDRIALMGIGSGLNCTMTEIRW